MKEYFIFIYYWLLVAVLFDSVVSTGTFDQVSGEILIESCFVQFSFN